MTSTKKTSNHVPLNGTECLSVRVRVQKLRSEGGGPIFRNLLTESERLGVKREDTLPLLLA